MNHFDSSIILWLNQFVLRSGPLNKAMLFLSDSNLLKGHAFMLVIWYFWFEQGARRERNREIISATLVAAFATLILGRLVAFALPFRVRPVFNETLGFVSPPGLGGNLKLRSWSAFPSDHAMLFAALSTGLFFVSRRIGAAAFAYWLLIVGMPRVYLGLHHPTDILGGALLGTGVACAVNAEGARGPLAAKILAAEKRRPGWFYAALFFVAVQVGTMFDEPRTMAMELLKALKGAR